MTSGIRWTFLGIAAGRVITFASTIALARLLVPADFGLVALAILAIGIIGVFGDLGFGAAQILRQDLGREEQRTILTVTLLAGGVIAALSAAAAPVAALLFDEPRLNAILPVLSLNTFATGLGWFYETLLQRELEFRARFIALLTQALTYAGLAVALAALGAGVWSIVFGTLAGTVAYSVVLLVLAPYRVVPAFRAAVARDVWRSGRGFVVQGGTAFLRQNVDFLAVGQAGGAAALGIYGLAYRVAELPKIAIADPVASVTFPVFSRTRSRGTDPAQSFLSLLCTLALLTCLIGALLSAAAEPFVRLVYGEQWLGMIGPLVVFGLWAALRPLEVTMGWLLNSSGEAGAVARIGALTLMPLSVAVVAAARLWGITAVAGVLLVEIVATSLLLVELLRRRLHLAPRRLWTALRPGLLAMPAGWAAARVVAVALDDGAPALALALAVGAGTGAYVAAAAMVDGAAVRAGFRQVARMLGRPLPAR